MIPFVSNYHIYLKYSDTFRGTDALSGRQLYQNRFASPKKVDPYQKGLPMQESKQEVPKNIFLVQNDGNSIKFEQLAVDVVQNC